MKAATKADAARWFDANEGQEINTRQVRPDGMVWEPGTRVLSRRGKNRWELDGSEVRLTSQHVAWNVRPNSVSLEWLDEDGTTIHITTYSLAPVEDDDANDWED